MLVARGMRRTYAPNIYRQLLTQFSAKHVTIISRTLLCRRRPIAREISAISQEQPLCIISPAIDTNPAILEIPIQSDIFKITRMKATMYLRFGAYLFESCGHVYVLCQFMKTSGRILQLTAIHLFLDNHKACFSTFNLRHNLKVT